MELVCKEIGTGCAVKSAIKSLADEYDRSPDPPINLVPALACRRLFQFGLYKAQPPSQLSNIMRYAIPPYSIDSI